MGAKVPYAINACWSVHIGQGKLIGRPVQLIAQCESGDAKRNFTSPFTSGVIRAPPARQGQLDQAPIAVIRSRRIGFATTAQFPRPANAVTTAMALQRREAHQPEHRSDEAEVVRPEEARQQEHRARLHDHVYAAPQNHRDATPHRCVPKTSKRHVFPEVSVRCSFQIWRPLLPCEASCAIGNDPRLREALPGRATREDSA